MFSLYLEYTIFSMQITSRPDKQKAWATNISKAFQNIFLNWQVCSNYTAPCLNSTEGKNSAYFTLMKAKTSNALRLLVLQCTWIEASNDLEFSFLQSDPPRGAICVSSTKPTSSTVYSQILLVLSPSVVYTDTLISNLCTEISPLNSNILSHSFREPW